MVNLRYRIVHHTENDSRVRYYEKDVALPELYKSKHPQNSLPTDLRHFFSDLGPPY